MGKEKQRRAWNKGLKDFGEAWLKPTQYQKGHLRFAAARKWRPVGTIVIRRQIRKQAPLYNTGAKKKTVSYIRWIKWTDDPSIPTSRRWTPYARYLWEQRHGSVPKNKCVVHMDMDTLNDHEDNHALMTHGEWYNYLNSHFPEHNARRLEALSHSLRGKRRKTPQRHGRKFVECISCGFEIGSHILRCPKCNGLTFEEISTVLKKNVVGESVRRYETKK